MKVVIHRVELPLQHEFVIARGSLSVQQSLIVELQHDGICGFGEATAHPYYGVTIDSMVQSIDQCQSAIEDFQFESADELWNQLQPRLAYEMFLLAAIDSAAHDFFGKLAGRATHQMLGLSWGDVPESSFTIGIDTIDRMTEKLSERSEWSAYKIKLGTAHDIEIVKQLRQQTAAILRVDANCGWTADETIANSFALKDLGVEFIEQPLPADAPRDEQRRVKDNSALPIIADESCRVESDVEQCEGLFHGINVKLSKCGGITPGLRMLRRARAADMKTMVGCMVESTVGISAAAQLLPLLDYADLDGAELLAGDVAHGVSVTNGVVRLPESFGNGVELFESVTANTAPAHTAPTNKETTH